MAVMKRFYQAFFLSVVVGAGGWLLMYDKAAQPGALNDAHHEIAACEACHTPWEGVNDDNCLRCHNFDDVSALKPQIRFHEAEKHCTGCHEEHLGESARISRVDHTLFNGRLECTQCHLDKHEGLFGQYCRQCHGIHTWEVDGFRHPPRERRHCRRCHNPPFSHHDPVFWSRIVQSHSDTPGSEGVSLEECWKCHTIHKWRHLMMDHSL